MLEWDIFFDSHCNSYLDWCWQPSVSFNSILNIVSEDGVMNGKGGEADSHQVDVVRSHLPKVKDHHHGGILAV